MNKIRSILITLTMFAPLALGANQHKSLTAKDIESMKKELSNWGRWGADDQKGALNLITPQTRKDAAALVTEGISVSTARDVIKTIAPDNPRPFMHTMVGFGEQWNSDNYSVSYHGFAHSHMDALCHYIDDGKLYNGFSANVVTEMGAGKLDIRNAKQGIFTRGVLIDAAKLKGVKYLEPGTALYPEDLDAWEKMVGVKIRKGDAVLLHTGRWARRDELGPWESGSAGLYASCARWLKERDIAVMGSDGGSDVSPSGIEGYSSPIHLMMLNVMGVPILDNLELERLAQKCDELGRYEFLLTVAPIPVEGGTGSPLNPIATF
ncbi:MAG: cyclase family protein [Verrucomicrobia bacterium]|nr:cyclase family protein [Verrucomicrobiota bacterium]MDA1067296.1 cyclase family protein [Verrucomicrobiota bacterium]